MQCLGSPTRAEIDAAHSKGGWLDIGLISLKNIRGAKLYRRILWWSLAITTTPLHLLWNSAISISLSSQNYTAWVVPNDFALFNTTITTDPFGLGYYTGFTVGYPRHVYDYSGRNTLTVDTSYKVHDNSSMTGQNVTFKKSSYKTVNSDIGGA